ncbi:MAG: hypothetical protein HOI95_01395 [Chromatiales bacterium]|jgi:hypothetical protein|nr:hypothetical protein [Chromatiales bacterium]
MKVSRRLLIGLAGWMWLACSHAYGAIIAGPGEAPQPSAAQLAAWGLPATASVVPIKNALALLRPGGELVLLPGTYEQKSIEDVLEVRTSGTSRQPIVIRGLSGNTVIRGMRDSTPLETVAPFSTQVNATVPPGGHTAHTCLRVEGQAWVEIHNVQFESCGTAIHVSDSHHITVREVAVTGGRYAVYAEGRGTHHVLLEASRWTQDPAGHMWARNHWCEYKYGAYADMNGALFGSRDITGNVIIRHNVVRHAFNAIRTDISKRLRSDARLRGELSVNFHIHDNRFEFVRDNVVEPEFDAVNWWIHDNQIHNAHAWFSFDGLHGGAWQLYNNVGGFDDRPSLDCDDRCQQWAKFKPSACGDPHNGGRVVKFRGDGRGAPGPLNIFNNSWYLRSSVTKRGRIGSIGHWNNAIEYCSAAAHGPNVCNEGQRFFRRFTWDALGYRFSHDLSNHADYPGELRRQGYLVNGTSVPPSQALFVSGKGGNFTRMPGTPGLGQGCFPSVQPSGWAQCKSVSSGSGIDIGYQAGFEHRTAIRYRDATEKTHGVDNGLPLTENAPRLVDTALLRPTAPDTQPLFVLWFSRPITFRVGAVVRVRSAGETLRLSNCKARETALRCAWTGNNKTSASYAIALHAGSVRGIGAPPVGASSDNAMAVDGVAVDGWGADGATLTIR